jgi:HlyD family secretion protein
MKRIVRVGFLCCLLLQSCTPGKEDFDASGSFEADEIIVSAELGGQLLAFDIAEGDSIARGQVVGAIDAEDIALQKEQVQASIEALSQKTSNVSSQVALLQDQIQVQQSQLANLLHEQERTARLVKADAATGKQLDDITAQVDVVRKQIAVNRQQINVQKSNTGTQNRSILSERSPLQKRIAQLDEQLTKSKVINPVGGIVLTKYAERGEVTAPGKPLYKVADLSFVTLRAYVTGVQLPQIKTGQAVTVLVDNGKDAYKSYNGTITWISDKAEFTPKTIQTKEERANLVYAIKVKTKNDGFLKIGMYGAIKFNENE